MNLLRWIRERTLPPTVRQRRRYLEALRAQQPFAAIHSAGAPDVRATHSACGLRHLPWEYCPAQPGNPSGGEWWRDPANFQPAMDAKARHITRDVLALGDLDGTGRIQYAALDVRSHPDTPRR